MDVTHNGDSTVVSDADAVRDAFGITPSGDAIPEVVTNEPAKEPEGSAPEKSEPVLSKGNDEVKQVDQGQTFKKKANEAHQMVIDLLEDKFNSLQNGHMEDDELRSWFDSHPEMAEVANRSKRVKDRFRSLMERDHAVEHNDQLRVKRKEQTRKDVQEIDDKEPEDNNSLDGRPLTLKDLQKYDEEREARFLERNLLRQREELLEEFAVSKNVMDSDVDNLRKNAEALFKINPDWSFSEVLERTYAALYPTKGRAVTVSSQHAEITSPKEEKLDASKGIPLMTFEEFAGNKK